MIDTRTNTRSLNLLLHCGGAVTEFDDPAMRAEPAMRGARHRPIPHDAFFETVERQLSGIGLTMTQSVHALANDGARYFGMMEVQRADRPSSPEWSTVIGLRASHDQAFAAQIVAGSGVFVCDNLCFSGAVKVGTKQTTYFADRLPEMVHGALRRVATLVDVQEDKFDRYKRADLPERLANASITEMIRRGVITGSMAPRVIAEWDEPSHEEFAQSKNVWRLHNAVTEAYKPTGQTNAIGTLTTRSTKLGEVCDLLAA